MTPAARVAAAIEVLDLYLSGTPAEQALTNWARGHRFAGSGDRAAIRDHVFDAIRCRRSFAALGGSGTGRGLMIGALRSAGRDPGDVFTGDRFAPSPLTATERTAPDAAPTRLERLDCPDWIAARLVASLGSAFEPVMESLRQRAPIFLRVNTLVCDVESARSSLAEEGIEAEPHALSPTALKVTSNPRRIRQSTAFDKGWIELQDAASQAVVDALADPGPSPRILDYCAGGGGKSLAMAARFKTPIVAHDAYPARMSDLPARAARAKAQISIETECDALPEQGFDLVLCDVPCSGTGAWRRQPDAKWRLTEDGLKDLIKIQTTILEHAGTLVAPGGTLAYATCSLLDEENVSPVETVMSRKKDWQIEARHRWTPLDGGDGFGLTILTRGSS